MPRVAIGVDIPDDEIVMTYGTSRGPGGQNVNKVSTAAILLFDVSHSRALSDEQKQLIRSALGRRVTADGVLRIRCDEYRQQSQNRREASRRFVLLLGAALRPRKARHATKPTRGSRVRRENEKRVRSAVKRDRRTPPSD